jgi:hypothetical protein
VDKHKRGNTALDTFRLIQQRGTGVDGQKKISKNNVLVPVSGTIFQKKLRKLASLCHLAEKLLARTNFARRALQSFSMLLVSGGGFRRRHDCAAERRMPRRSTPARAAMIASAIKANV